MGLVLMAKNDTPEGFAAFYELIMGLQLPPHAREWADTIYAAHEQDKGVVIEAFRGSTKTTTITIAFAAFRIGHQPHKSYLLIQVGDDIATDNTGQIADIIANNPGWKKVFPHVEPDREQGWGADGYDVKNTNIDYAEWRALCGSAEGKGKDPTFIGLGYKSRAIIGKHPTGGLFVDDIHDENNTSSDRELRGVIQRMTGTIFPTMVPGAWKVFIGTPWVEGDALDYCKGTGEFVCTQTPVIRNGHPLWPEKFNQAEIDKQRKLAGEREYARMFLLDLSIADVDGLKFFTYPHDRIDIRWPSAGGCDYASVMQEKNVEQDGRSYFAHYWGFKDPYNRIVIFDGVVEQCTQLQAEAHLWKPQTLFDSWKHTEFEADGKGEEALAVFQRNPSLRLNPFKVQRIKKTLRHERQVAPWLENGKIMISDADTPALNRLREALRKWPNGNLDVIDALYALIRAFPECLTVEDISDGIPQPGQRKAKKVNPYKAWCQSSW